MRESMIREIETEYEVQRAANRAEEARRLVEATQADAAIGTLVKERANLFQDGARKALANPRQAKALTEAMAARMAAIAQELRSRLVALRLPEDYLQPVYHCPICQDTGHTGDLVRERCTCFAQKLRRRTVGVDHHGLSPRETFEAYDEAVFSDAPQKGTGALSQRAFMENKRRICEQYAADYPGNERPNVLLFGTSGLGKTYLLNSIGNRLHAQGVEVLKITSYQLSERMRASAFEQKREAFSILLEVPVLLLDDLGVEPIYNNLSLEHLFTLLNERLLAGLHTVISTNLALHEISTTYSERLASRLLDKRNTYILQFCGQDIRLGR